MSARSRRNGSSSRPKAPAQAAMVQVAGVGFGFMAALLLAGIVFLATGLGSETEALGVFPAWVLIFIALIWRATTWRQPVVRGLALLGAEFLALPLSWLLYQGLPSLSVADPRVRQTLSALAVSLALAAVLLGGSFLLWRAVGRGDPAPTSRALLALGAAAFLGEALYGLVLLARSLMS